MCNLQAELQLRVEGDCDHRHGAAMVKNPPWELHTPAQDVLRQYQDMHNTKHWWNAKLKQTGEQWLEMEKRVQNRNVQRAIRCEQF